MRATRWLWDERLELRTLALFAGGGRIGKSTIALDIAAKVSRGTLPGYYLGKPKGVVASPPPRTTGTLSSFLD